jgi:hypothetical protein
LVEQIKTLSTAVEDLANAGARVETRDVRIVQDIYNIRVEDVHNELLDRQAKLEESVLQLMQVVISSKTLTERISINVCGISETTYRLEYHHLVKFLAPAVPPQAVLLKVKSFSRRDPTTSLPSLDTLKIKRILQNWASADRFALLVVHMGLHAQKQARDLAADIIQGLALHNQCVFWNLWLPRISEGNDTMASVFKALIHQLLQHSADLFAQFAKQLNLVKINSAASALTSFTFCSPSYHGLL